MYFAILAHRTGIPEDLNMSDVVGRRPWSLITSGLGLGFAVCSLCNSVDVLNISVSAFVALFVISLFCISYIMESTVIVS